MTTDRTGDIPFLIGRCSEHGSAAEGYADGSSQCLYCQIVETNCECNWVALVHLSEPPAVTEALRGPYSNAAPRPWTVDILEGGGWAVVVDADSDGAKVIAELDDTHGDRAANAALIVEAVNRFGVGTALDSVIRGRIVDMFEGEYGEVESLAAFAESGCPGCSLTRQPDTVKDALRRLAAARFVAEHWRDSYMERVLQGDSAWGVGTHPLALVLGALDGETDPRELGLPEESNEAFAAALVAATPPAPVAAHQHVGPVGTVTCYASHAETPHDLVPQAASPGEGER